MTLHHQRTSIRDRIEALNQAAANAVDPDIVAAKISAYSDRKKYAFAEGLQNDLRATRAALRSCCASRSHTTFGEVFTHTAGSIANLNRVLQNLRKAREIEFEPECFFDGVHNDEIIELRHRFWEEEYTISESNVFQPGRVSKETPENERRGRSYVTENLKTQTTHHCCVCREEVNAEDRITVRANVYHLKCISCTVCQCSPRQKADYVTFDGQLCCSVACIQKYDAAHLRQERD